MQDPKTQMQKTQGHKLKPIGMAILAAALYGISAPVSKLLLVELSPTMMAALLYLGAGFGMLLVNVIRSLRNARGRSMAAGSEARMTRQELPYALGMIVLDILAPICLMLGLRLTTSANAALLNNFEIVATSLIALFIFKEAIGKRMWLAIIMITIASMLLSVNDFSSFTFSIGSVLVLAACVCWGFENNCTRKLSLKDPLQIVVVKGIGSGCGSLLIYFLSKGSSSMTASAAYVILTLLLGFVAYGLSIFFYVSAQREMGAARTSAYYAAAPFIGVLLSWLIFREGISWSFLAALLVMIVGTYFAITENHDHYHVHCDLVHDHRHNHHDGHHNHTHNPEVKGEHSHEHHHEVLAHQHPHLPDLHHQHQH